MKREIKFRAWDGKEMHYNVCVNHKQKAIKYGYRGADWVEDANAGIPMQYTGLMDKSKNEIYEGDILKCSSKNVFSLGEISFKRVIWGSCHWHIEGTFMTLSEYLEYGDCEVCGNIYENPELVS